MRVLFVLGILFALWIGGTFTTYIMGGVITFLGIAFLIETIPWLKSFASKYGNFIDILLFGFAIYASVAMSVTVAMAFGIAGLGYTMAYKPYIMENKKEKYDPSEHGGRPYHRRRGNYNSFK